jgi:hypothetical protein
MVEDEAGHESGHHASLLPLWEKVPPKAADEGCAKRAG